MRRVAVVRERRGRIEPWEVFIASVFTALNTCRIGSPHLTAYVRHKQLQIDMFRSYTHN